MAVETRRDRHRQVHELRPARKAYGRAVLYGAPLPLGITLRNVLGNDLRWWVDLLTVVTSLLVIGGFLLLWFRVARVRVAERSLEKRNLFGRTCVIALDRIATVLLVPHYVRFNTPASTLLVFLDAAARPLVRLDGLHWDSTALQSIAHATGAPVERLDGEVRPKDLRRSHPHAPNLIERRPVLVWTVVGVVLVLIIGVAILAVTLGWCRPGNC